MTDLINTLEAPGEFDALPRLRPGEPYFLLIGRDGSAPALVQKWADINRDRAVNEFNDGLIDKSKRDEELRKSTQAEAIGWSMTEYKRGQVAVEVQSSRPSYSGFELDEATAKRDAIQAARVRASSALYTARAEALEVQRLLADDPEQKVLVEQIEAILAGVDGLAQALKPARPGMQT